MPVPGWMAAVLCVAAPALAACQERPRVFAPGPDDAAALMQSLGGGGLDDDGALGVFVAGVDGAPEAFDSALTAALASRLLAHDVLASARTANRASRILEAHAVLDGAAARIAWRLVDADDVAVVLMDQSVPGGAAAWSRGGPALVRALATEAAPRLAALIRDGPAPREEALPPPAELRIAVGAVSGAPGDGNVALADATRAALAAAGFRLAPGGAAPFLVGAVSVRAGGANDLVAVSWRLLGRDGSEIGAFSQEGTAPAGRLDGRWGALADAIARGAALGVAELLSAVAPGG